MYRIEIGEFDGNSWEDLMQRCWKDKYEKELFQRMPALVDGDSGIEGFTLATGIVFQSYCPERQYEAAELYAKQRDKINVDLKKLIKYKKDLKGVLGNQLIKEWHFVTPEFTNKALNAYCRTKEQEYRDMGEDHLDPEFRIIIKEYTDYIIEIVRHTSLMKLKLDIAVHVPFEIDWELCDSGHVENLRRKIGNLFQPYEMDEEVRTSKVKQVVESYIYYYQRGLKVLNKLEDDFPEKYGVLKKIKSSEGENVEDKCMFPIESKKEFLSEINVNLLKELKAALGDDFQKSSLEQLTKQIVSEWLMHCSLNFGGEYE